MFVHFCCCLRFEHPSLKCNGIVPKFLQWKCANDQCANCGSDSVDILLCPILNDHSCRTNCNEWHHAPRPAVSSSGAQTTQLELGSFRHTIHETLTKIHAHLPIVIQHQAELRQKHYSLKLEASHSDPTTIVFCSNFGATLDLMAKETDDFSVDDHATARILRAACGQKDVEHGAIDHDNNQSLAKTKRISQVDRWIAFVDTLSKGKKNDHCTHYAFMKHTNEHHE